MNPKFPIIMTEGIELHDSTLEAVQFRDGSITISLRPAYVHRPGTGWLQDASVTIGDATAISSPTQLPAEVWTGSLRNGETCHDNLIPLGGTFEGDVEFSVALNCGETVKVLGRRVTIELHGDPQFLEQTPF